MRRKLFDIAILTGQVFELRKCSRNRIWTLLQLSWNVKVVINFPRQHSQMYFGSGSYSNT